MTETVIVSGARTPIGKFGGAFADFSGAQLGGFAIKAALERAGARPSEVDYVIMGQVLQAGAGTDHRPSGRDGGRRPDERPGVTINKVCLSGLNAIALADQLIRAGEVERVVAGGMESMTNAPYLAPEDAVRRADGQRRAHRLDDVRRAVLRVRPQVDGRRRPTSYNQRYELSARGAGRVRRALASARCEGHRGRASSTTRSSRSRSRSARATRSSWRRTRASAPTRRSTRSASCVRPSRRKGRSPPATRRRSPTAAPRRVVMSRRRGDKRWPRAARDDRRARAWSQVRTRRCTSSRRTRSRPHSPRPTSRSRTSASSRSTRRSRASASCRRAT